MKIKRFLIIIVINIICILFLILSADLIYVYYQNNYHIVRNGFRLLPYTEFFNESKSRDEDSGVSIPSKIKAAPAVISGCSIAYGLFLPFEETIGYLISKLTNRKVYNRGRCSACISHVLYELTETDVYDKMEKPEYMFFIYDPVLHAPRINAYTFTPENQIEYLRYKTVSDGRIVHAENYKIPFLPSLSLFRHFMFNYRMEKSLSEENRDLTIALFDKVNKEIHKKFPDIKFAVILYEGNMNENSEENNFYYAIISGIKNKGIDVISINDIINDKSNQDKYKSDNAHPSSIIWQKAAPYLIDKYGL